MHAMDSLLSYESSGSSSDSDGEAWTKGQSRLKKTAIEQTPVLVTRDSESEEEEPLPIVNSLGSDGSEPEVSDSRDGGPTFGPEGFQPTHRDDPDMDTEALATYPPSVPLVGKRNPYALNIRDLNPRMRAFLASVKTYFTQKVNLERQKAALSASTYNKALERVLGMYMFFLYIYIYILLFLSSRLFAVKCIRGCKYLVLKACFGQCFITC